jgi:lipid-A-disaccharide synthase
MAAKRSPSRCESSATSSGPRARQELQRVREVLFVAGEASGDLHAAGVARELSSMRPDLHLAGVGGSLMRAEGVELLEHTKRLAVMGAVEILKSVPRHVVLLRALKRRLQGGDVALLILIDYPGFNFKVAAAARAAGVPVLYYVTPQVWAWHASRLPTMAKIITKAAVILPFEETLLRSHHIDATFVGHPLLDRAGELPERGAARQALGLPDDAPVLALFPGSRAQEVKRHLEPFVATAKELQRRVTGLRVVVCVARTISLDASDSPFPLVRDNSYGVLRAADAALCKSGTTTLEAAVAGCPLVVAYRMNALSYAIGSRMVRIPHIGLVNVVADREVAPEFVQDALQPVPVADALEPLLRPGSAPREAMLRGLADVRARLGTAGAAARVARMASELVG